MSMLQYVTLGLRLAEAAAAGIAAAQEGKRLVEQLVAEGRDPTPEEWAALDAASAALHARIQAAADRG
ncbi:MAG: hypothetical protein LDL44_11125 [Caenispirillum sp.]|nr:hypothetical protein [Caenispirillum sp.]